jgi:hypothetical protein
MQLLCKLYRAPPLVITFANSVCVSCCTAQELYSGGYIALAGAATGFTVGPHVLMSLLLIVRQGWLAAASQAVGFILTLNPFENLTPIPQGIVGLFMLSIGFIAYVLIAASGGWGLLWVGLLLAVGKIRGCGLCLVASLRCHGCSCPACPHELWLECEGFARTTASPCLPGDWPGATPRHIVCMLSCPPCIIACV